MTLLYMYLARILHVDAKKYVCSTVANFRLQYTTCETLYCLMLLLFKTTRLQYSYEIVSRTFAAVMK